MLKQSKTTSESTFQSLFPIIEFKTLNEKSKVILFGFASRNQWRAVIFCTQETTRESYEQVIKLKKFGFDTLIKKCTSKEINKIFELYKNQNKEIMISKEFSSCLH